VEAAQSLRPFHRKGNSGHALFRIRRRPHNRKSSLSEQKGRNAEDGYGRDNARHYQIPCADRQSIVALHLMRAPATETVSREKDFSFGVADQLAVVRASVALALGEIVPTVLLGIEGGLGIGENWHGRALKKGQAGRVIREQNYIAPEPSELPILARSPIESRFLVPAS
jgi:hypothetical protein